MAKAKVDDPWHYPGKGDYPLVGELVWVQAVSLAPWRRLLSIQNRRAVLFDFRLNRCTAASWNQPAFTIGRTFLVMTLLLHGESMNRRKIMKRC